MDSNTINIIGAGLAGSEAALQLAKKGFKVNLYEMRPDITTGAHTTKDCAEFVCSNSLGSYDITNASGLLKHEMEVLGGELIEIAKACQVPAGNALAIDRHLFAKTVTQKIEQNENITLIRKEITEIPDTPTIIASGPLTSSKFCDAIKKFTNSEYLHFFDAIAPIIEKDSINFDIAFWASRYDKGEASYINCPMNKEQYENFYNILIHAPRIEQHDFEKGAKFFESCLPIEVLASRGVDTLRFGPMKPVGLIDKRTAEKNYAVVQLRQDNSAKTLYNLVGFQTNLKWGAQKELLQSIPGLENVNIVRYGVMHRNSFINAPLCLNACSQLKEHKNIFIAGQLSGVEGYVESIGSGLVAAINMYRHINKKNLMPLPPTTCMGAILNYIANSASPFNFQPMNANYGIIVCEKEFKDKKEKKKYIYENSMQEIDKFLHKCFLVENNKS